MKLEDLQKTKERLDAVSPSFCTAKWMQVTLHLYKGSSQSCCFVPGHRIGLDEIAANPSALHNTASKIKVREELLAGKFPWECRYCWNMEKLGTFSERHHRSAADWALPHLAEAASSASKHITPSYVELAFDNVCNFKCMYCSPSFSTLWEQEIEKHGAYPTSGYYNSKESVEIEHGKPITAEEKAKYIEAFWRWWPELYPKLKHLRVTGGEPLLSPETWKLMDRIEESEPNPIHFGINSNLSLSPRQMDRLLEKLDRLSPKVKRLQLFCSVDSVGAQAEYMRHGLKYERFMENVERILREAPANLSLNYMITVNALSLPGTLPLLRVIGKQKRDYPTRSIGIDPNYLHHPELMSVLVLPRSFQRYLVDAATEMPALGFNEIEVQKVKRIVEAMNASPHKFLRLRVLRRDLWKFLQEHDRRRGTDIRKTFPEYRAFFNSCEYFLGIPSPQPLSV